MGQAVAEIVAEEAAIESGLRAATLAEVPGSGRGATLHLHVELAEVKMGIAGVEAPAAKLAVEVQVARMLLERTTVAAAVAKMVAEAPVAKIAAKALRKIRIKTLAA